MAEPDPVAVFWAWWPSFVLKLGEAASAVALEENAMLLSNARRIHPKVQVLGRYKLAQGAQGAQGDSWLCLSGRGDLGARALTERWLAAAPGSSGWRFLAARPRSWPPERVPTPFPLAEFSIEAQIDELREVAHVTLHHEGVRALEPVQRAQLAFIALDHLLGEDDVERWIGRVEVSVDPLPAGEPITALRPRIEALAAAARPERWQVLRGTLQGAPFLVTVNRAIKPLDHLALDIHARIDVRLVRPNVRGLAVRSEALELDALQDDLKKELGTRGLLVARETHRCHRILHLHVDRAAARDLETWRHKHPERAMAVLTQPDPDWKVLMRWG